MKFGVVIEVSTFLVITQVSSGVKQLHKYLHVKIASLANVKSYVIVVSVDYLSGLPFN